MVAPAAPATDAVGVRMSRSFILGLVSMVAWFLPIIGSSVSAAGIWIGLSDLYQNRPRTLRRAGLILSICGLALSLANAALGVAMGG